MKDDVSTERQQETTIRNKLNMVTSAATKAATGQTLGDMYLTEKQTAAITQEALATLRNNRSLRRGLPYLKIGGRAIRYKLSDVVAYMERQRIDPEKEA